MAFRDLPDDSEAQTGAAAAATAGVVRRPAGRTELVKVEQV